jgi:hypothetical protein
MILRVGTTIGKGELRLGTLVEVMGKTSLCVCCTVSAVSWPQTMTARGDITTVSRRKCFVSKTPLKFAEFDALSS